MVLWLSHCEKITDHCEVNQKKSIGILIMQRFFSFERLAWEIQEKIQFRNMSRIILKESHNLSLFIELLNLFTHIHRPLKILLILLFWFGFKNWFSSYYCLCEFYSFHHINYLFFLNYFSSFENFNKVNN